MLQARQLACPTSLRSHDFQHARRRPFRAHARPIRARLSSVTLLPVERMAAITAERFSLLNTSVIFHEHSSSVALDAFGLLNFRALESQGRVVFKNGICPL